MTKYTEKSIFFAATRRRCLLLPEGMRALSRGLASYSLLCLVLQLLRVGPRARTVSPLTLREAQGVLFAVQVCT